jgi:hypothetical protein
MKVPDEHSTTVGLLAFAVVELAFLFASIESLSPVMAQQTTDTTTVVPEISETMELRQLLVIYNDPFYQSTSGNLTSMRIVSVSPSVVIQEQSFVERAFMRNIGNVTTILTFVDNINHGEGIVQGAGRGIISTDNGDLIRLTLHSLGLLTGFDNDNNNDTSTTTENDTLNTERTTTYRGIVFFDTDSERLSFMNNVVGLYITQVNEENGTSFRQIWEWRNN